VGHSASGLDLANQISLVSIQPLIISERAESVLSLDNTGIKKYLPEIKELIVENRSVRFANGHIENKVDFIVFCTGYMYSYPFLTTLSPPVVSNGARVQNLYQHIFYYPRPTLSFLGLPKRIVPFPVSEAQVAYVARILSGRLQLPSNIEMKNWEEALLANTGEKGFHTMGFPLDASYINELHALSMSALLRPELSNEGKGKITPYWGVEEQWTRERFLLIKQASMKLGAKRREITNLKDLGFDFEEWKSNETMAKIQADSKSN